MQNSRCAKPGAGALLSLEPVSIAKRAAIGLLASSLVACAGNQEKPPETTKPSAEAAPASWAQIELRKVRIDHGQDGGMRECKGMLTPAARTFFASLYEKFEKCGVEHKPTRPGEITFHSTLEEGGGLSEFSVLEDRLETPALTSCIQEVALTSEFREEDPKTPCVQLTHPLEFR